MLQYLRQAVFKLFLLPFVLFSERSYGADYRFEECVPSDCGGVSISFPFYVPGRQQSYCGYPGFELSCPPIIGSPVLKLLQNDYVVKQISYQDRLFRVYNAVVLSLNDSVCIPSIKNTTLPTPPFQYVNVANLHFFPNCSKNLTRNLWPYRVICERPPEGDYWDLSIDDKDVNLRYALENCETHVVAPVDVNSDTNIFSMLRWGFLLNWVAGDCSPCEKSGGRCGFNETSNNFRCFCPDRSYPRTCNNPLGVSPAASPTEVLPPLTHDPISTKGKGRKTLILATGVSVAVVIVTVISVFLFIFFRKKLLNLPGIPKAKTQTQMDIKLFLKNHGNLAPKIYKYSELKKITNSFSDNLGKGGYGSVYKGELQDGRLVAVKILNESKGNGEEFMNEVASISRTSHVNIVALLGFCSDGSKRALVYEFLPNGSLDKYIPNSVSSTAGVLGWEKLFEIAVGIARGLDYLHQGCTTRILHFDIKPHNILLDKDLKPKISDFGLAKLCPNRSSIVSMPGARGTAGYIAPEVFCRNFGQVSHKSDVYSYGMMVLEMVLGRKNLEPQSDRSSEMYFTDWIYKSLEQNVETSGILVEGDELELAKKKLIIIGLWCIQTEPKNRPSISRVIEMLEGEVESLQIPPRPYLSSSPKSTASILDSDSIYSQSK